MEGPQFSSRAESNLYRDWNCDVIGMTNMPEAKLSREAEICYASVAMVTDYDCWKDDRSAVEVGDIVKVLDDNADRGRSLVSAVAPALVGRSIPCAEGCDRVLDSAVITPPEARELEITSRLDAVAGRIL
jgi:5'-methylthioadenosine phosphorylase